LCMRKLFLPLRISRFCCEKLKERQIPELRYATHSFGVRKFESVSRDKKRNSIEMRNQSRARTENVKHFHFDNTDKVKNTGMCYTHNYFIVNPLAYWNDNVLWDYIGGNNLEINPLYNQGFCRVGCIGCPMASYEARQIEFERYPKYKQAFLRLCDYIVTERKERGLKTYFKNGQDYFDYWLEVEPQKLTDTTDDLSMFSTLDN